MADPTAIADYIRQAAQQRGIDPETAIRVFTQESGLRPDARNISDREESYGIPQLNVKGGLGVAARQAGIEPSDPTQWPRHVDFALDTAAKDGWRQWYGARDVGIGRWDGIGGAPTAAPQAAPPVYAPVAAPYARNQTEPDGLAGVFTASAAPRTTFVAPKQQISSPPQMPEEDVAATGIFDPRTTLRSPAKLRKS